MAPTLPTLFPQHGSHYASNSKISKNCGPCCKQDPCPVASEEVGMWPGAGEVVQKVNKIKLKDLGE